VELGKVMAKQLEPALTSQDAPTLDQDSSTGALVRHYRQLRNRPV
jgi:glucose-6-phosphate isomerase